MHRILSSFARRASSIRNASLKSPRGVPGKLLPPLVLRTISLQHAPLMQIPFDRRGGGNIDESFHRLDAEIKRTGRINRSEIEEILNDIRDMKKATSSQSMTIIRCCGDLLPEDLPENRTKLVQEIWRTMENLNVPMDISHYNALLRVYLENEHKFNPTEFLQNLDKKGIEPNRVTYQRLIARFCQEGDIDGASTILQYMKEKQLPINEHVFNGLVLGHAQASDMESAEGIINVMRQAGLEPNDDTFVTLMCGYAKNGDIENVKRIVKDCEGRETVLVDKDFMQVIYTLAKNGHVQLIDEVIPFLRVHAGFNQDAIILIIKLVNIGHEDIGYKILKMMPRQTRQGHDEQFPSGFFFIRQMVKADTPPEKVVKLCQIMQEEGLNTVGLVKACEYALGSAQFEKAFDFLEALNNEGVVPMRQHFFWPFFAGAPKTEQEIYYGIKCMLFLGVVPNLETLREYILPALLNATKGKESIESTIEKLSGHTRIPISNIVPAAMSYFLLNNELEIGARFAGKFRLKWISNGILRQQLINSYLRNRETKHFVHLLGSAAFDGDDYLRETVGQVLVDLSQACKIKERAAILGPVLSMLLTQGFGISNSGAEFLQNSFGEELTPELSNTILQLTSSDLTPNLDYTRTVRQAFSSSGNQTLDALTIEQLEANLQRNIQAGLPTRAIMRQMFMVYCRDKNLEKAEQYKDELQREGFVFTTGALVMMMDLYAHYEKLEEAKEIFNEIKKREMGHEFGMDDVKILRYASLLLSKGEYEEGKEVLKTTNRRETNSGESVGQKRGRGANLNATVWKMLNGLAESGDAERVKEIFELVKERGFITPNNVVLGPLIKVYLVKEDLKGALAEYERCAKEYSFTPWKTELFCQFIRSDDPESLQKVLDLSTTLHGEVNSLYDLVFAFIECGKIRQAKKLLETPGLRPRNDKLEYTCQKFLENNKVEELEKLVAVTKDIFDIDRNSLYFYLLKAYAKNNDPDKALSVWTSLQEENIQPSTDLLIYLADFLRKNDRQVPFIEPEAEVLSISSELLTNGGNQRAREVRESSPSMSSKDRDVSNFRRSIQQNEIDTALQLKQRMQASNIQLSLEDESSLIDKMVQAERLGEAVKLTEDMLERGFHPFPKVLRFLVSKMGAAGEVSALTRIESRLSSELKKNISFNHRLCYAYTNAGRGKEYFENYMKGETGENLKSTDDPIFTASMYNVFLGKNPDLAEEFEEVAERAYNEGNILHYNSLWMHHLLNKNFDKAREIWNSKLNKASRVIFRSILIQTRIEKDEETCKEFVNQVFSSEFIGNENKAAAALCHVDVLCSKGAHPEAMKTFESYLRTLRLEDFNSNLLRSLKEKFESNGVKFPYQIPDRQPRESRIAGAVSA